LKTADSFNVFEAAYEPLRVELFAGARVEGRVLYRSTDGTHLVIASRYPDGVRYRGVGSYEYREAFYIVQGTGSRTLADGTKQDIRAGDLILVMPGLEQRVVYDPGLANVAFFWSAGKPLPDFTVGLTLPALAD